MVTIGYALIGVALTALGGWLISVAIRERNTPTRRQIDRAMGRFSHREKMVAGLAVAIIGLVMVIGALV